ncbi:MAG: hypothetical protein JXA25_08275 [Anaerolineales bacterium]|nr:hypothetical protein [Anaerolineales bacterium]
MSEVVKDVGRGFIRAGVLWMVSAGVAVVLSCVCLFIPLWLVTSREWPIWVLVVSGVVYLLVLGAIAGGVFYTIYHRRSKLLDAVFLPLGLEGSVYQLFFRQYHGQFMGRDLSVYFFRGPVLEIELATTLQTRFSFSQTVDNRLADLAGAKAMELTVPDLENVRVSGLDHEWVTQLLTREGLAEVILRLTEPPEYFATRTIYLRPGKMVQTSALNPKLFEFDLPAEEVRVWVEDLVTLLETAEGLPEPTVVADLSAIERTADSMRESSSKMWKWVGLVIGASLLCLLGVFLAAVFGAKFL